MKTRDKKVSKDKGKENSYELNKLNKSNKEKNNKKKNYIPLTKEDLIEQNGNNNDKKEEETKLKTETKQEKNIDGKNMKKNRTEVIRIRRRKEIINDTRGVKDEDKSRKKEIKREDSLSQFSVEFSEDIQKNGVFKKDDEELKKKIEKSIQEQKNKKKLEDKKKEGDKNKKGEKNKKN